jgi:hypothetical protein
MITKTVSIVRGISPTSLTGNLPDSGLCGNVGFNFTKREVDGPYVVTRIQEGGPSQLAGLFINDALRKVCMHIASKFSWF